MSNEEVLDFISLYNDGTYIDDGDMDRINREVLIKLVRGDIIYKIDKEGSYWDVIVGDNIKIKRDLSNLCKQLVVNESWEFAYAVPVPVALSQVNTSLSRVQHVDADIMYLAIKLRQAFERSYAQGEKTCRVDEDSIYELWSNSPFFEGFENDAQGAYRRFNGLLERLRKRSLGIVRKEPGRNIYQVMPSIMALVSDATLSNIVSNAESAKLSTERSAGSDE